MQREIASLQKAPSQQHWKSSAPAWQRKKERKAGRLAGKEPSSERDMAGREWEGISKRKVLQLGL